MLRFEKYKKKFFFDYEKVESHLAYMKLKNSGIPVGTSPIKTLMISNKD
jgi:hypothetical protein